MLRRFPRTIAELCNHPDFHLSRMGRCEAAAEHGADCSAHAERLKDMRDALEYMRSACPASLQDRTLIALNNRVERIEAEIKLREAWHEANGSLYREVG